MNTLKIEGGQEKVMLVPDRCRLVIDRCLVPGYGSQQALHDLNALIRSLGIDAEARLVDRETPFCEPFQIPNNNPYVQLVSNAVGRFSDVSLKSHSMRAHATRAYSLVRVRCPRSSSAQPGADCTKLKNTWRSNQSKPLQKPTWKS